MASETVPSNTVVSDSEDILTKPLAMEDEVKAEEKDVKEQDDESKAAVALTSLVDTSLPIEASTSGNDEERMDDEEEEEEECDERDFEIPQRFTRSGRRRATPFPLKLMKVLSTKEFSEIIGWLPSGKSFSIIKPKVFTVEILPTYFKSAKYSSFTRKLHRWGFMRHYRGPEAGAFYHKDFQKGRLDLVEQMTCHKIEPPKSSVTKAKQVRKSVPRDTIANAVGRSPRSIDMHSLARGPSMQSASFPPHPMDADLAIELEVARRLRQRMDAAAYNQQALLAMQQQQKLQALRVQNLGSHSLMGWDASPATSLPGYASSLSSLNMRGYGASSLPRSGFDQGYSMAVNKAQYDHAFNYSAYGDLRSYESNIHGAKTA
ncbi:predicted protein [Phaeodactylum tricornutum CCAP 1055/1]|uniref:HSF-type DNA-binding domain-containing protein n=1 Tax=Phaeodactylum tricornutum (strain CCAP 1055/1) TaxID=556484 RepID=B7GD29_PHATC|nr:predicted protein [Phaeodactylum tricornutum CCAP 1055/1]EEC43424.1 predicted protein [Phaeodactylum tricornutum CCAP 1055/1]|eukprot:XP_002184977.1 predicted protein [Phaeodactylum tricornutum CCAP 1055/1]